MPFSIRDLFHGKYNNFIKSYFKSCKKIQLPIFNNIDKIVKYLIAHCKKYIASDKQVYILAMETEADRIQQEVSDDSFCTHITKAISGKDFMDSYVLNERIEEDKIIFASSTESMDNFESTLN